MRTKGKLRTWGRAFLSFALAIILAFGGIPATVLAEGVLSAENDIVVTSGTWGTCSWEIDSAGALTVHAGTGADCEGQSPWSQYRWEITSIALEEGVILPSDCSCMLEGLNSLVSLDLSGWDTSSVSDMSAMFYSCSSLVSLDLSGWDTSSVTDMGGMFNGCSSLVSLDLSGWDTSSVVYMSDMFCGCTSLEAIDLSGWDTSSVLDMSGMFDVSSLVSLDLSGWDTSSVTNMRTMFNACHSLVSLDLSGWDTSSVKDMGGMFKSCYSLETINLSGWDTSSVTDMDQMFDDCSSLKAINVTSWDTTSVTHMDTMFDGCSSLKALDVTRWDTSSVINMGYMFRACSSLASLDLSGWDTSSVSWDAAMFDDCQSLASITIGDAYAIRSSDMFPDATATNGKWWSYENQQWYTKDEIVDNRSAIADTYANTEVGKPSASGIEILQVTSPANYTSKSKFGDTYMYTVPYKYHPTKEGTIPECAISMNVSKGATWSLYKDAQCAQPAETTKIVLPNDDGDNYFYVKVENGGISAVYCLNIIAEPVSDLINELCRTSATTYSPTLAAILSEFACAAYEENSIAGAYRTQCVAEDARYRYNYDNDYLDSVAFAIGTCGLPDGTPVIVVSIRGSSPTSDWINEICKTATVGLWGWHPSFENCANDVYKTLQSLGAIRNDGTKYVLCGHSRGAATANLLAVKLSDFGIPAANVYDYNFGCPDVAKGLFNQWNVDGEHDNIFNLARASDLVSVLPGVPGDMISTGMTNKSLLGMLVGPAEAAVDTAVTWGKFGRSYWFADDWDDKENTTLCLWSDHRQDEDAIMPGHSQGEDAKYFANKPSLDKARDYFGAEAAWMARLTEDVIKSLRSTPFNSLVLSFFCPVDIVIKDESGAKVAAAIDGEPEYYDSTVGEVLIIVDGDRKGFFLPYGKYTFEVLATDEGSMDCHVDRLVEGEADASKYFEGVSLTENKKMSASISEDVVEGTHLYVVDSNGTPSAEVLENGEEVPIALTNLSEAEVSVGNLTYTGQALTPNVTVTLGGTQLSASDFTVSYADSQGNAVEDIKDAGSYVATVTGVEEKGYTGQTSTTFTVDKADPHIGTVTADVVEDDLDVTKVVLHRTDTSVPGTLALADSSLSYGTATYNWTFTPADVDNYEVKEGTVEVTVTGHDWGQPTYVWSTDNATCTATRTCSNNSAHEETETSTATSMVTREPTETAEGERTYTATFENAAFETQVKKVSIPKKDSSVDPEPAPIPVPPTGFINIKVTYSAHVQGKGNLPAVSDGAIAGTIGECKRLEALRVILPDGGIRYRSHIQGIGWQDWVGDGELSGTAGQSRRVEALQMKLSVEVEGSGHHVWYRVHSQTYGWLGWAHDGMLAGTAGLSKRVEAYEVVILEGDATPEGYDATCPSYVGTVTGKAHVQTYGWQTSGSSLMLGTTGQSKRLEAIRLSLANQPYAGGIAYQVHERRNGWTVEKEDGALAGTTGESRRLEAVRITLTGDIQEHLSVWYRVHSQTYGWLGWAHDGEDAGTTGLSKRVEAIEVKTLPRGTTPQDYDATQVACIGG